MAELFVNDRLKKRWREAFMAHLVVIFQNLPGCTEEIHQEHMI
jgi:hypothetical protein